MLLVFQSQLALHRFKHKLEEAFGKLDFQDTDISFLGMNIEQLHDFSCHVTQPGYSAKICAAAGISTSVSTPATAKLLAAPDPKSIPHPEAVTTFKSLLMSMLFLATRTRPDVLKECVIIAGAEMPPTKETFDKLHRVYQYIYGTMEYGIVLGTERLQLTVYCDASYGVHPNGHSHSGILVNFGELTGPLAVKSQRQKLVTLSSTEAELVAVVEGTRRGLTIHRLLKEILPEYDLPVIIYQDNISTIHILTNGEGYSGKNRHMRVRYGYLTELLQSGVITIQHMPTEEMTADLLTKPIGGNVFRKLRAKLLNFWE
jgi:hypothetical protein